MRALAYIGGVPGALVPEQLKSGVTRACRYEPGIQRTYVERVVLTQDDGK